MSETGSAVSERSHLQIGVLMILAMLGFAALIGLVAVVDADGVGSAVGVGAGTAATVFATGGTIACALACLVRRRAEILALGGLAVSGLAVDLFVVEAWRGIDNEAYGKIAAIAFVWAFFGLLMLGLTLAVQARAAFGRWLYLGAMVAAAVAGLISTWLIATTGGAVTPLSPLGLESISGESLLRPLAGALILLSTLWFGALAASRLEQS
jgi:hypothetical protein